MQLSKNFSLEEMARSATATSKGISNTPDAMEIARLRALCADCLQPARDIYNKPIFINNGFRSAALNRAMEQAGFKVSATSQHMLGEAADIRDADRTKNKALFDVLFNLGNYDQLIWEDGNDNHPQWIHVSYKINGNRKQILRMLNGRTTHRNYDGINWK